MSGRRYIALAGIVVVLLGGGIYAWMHVPSDDVERATVGEALQNFRQDGEDGGRNPGESELGVYRYTTTGNESIDTSFIGTTHEYGGISTIVLTEDGCGLVERWQPLSTRWAETATCPVKRGSAFRRQLEYHEFFGRGEEVDYRCTGPSMTDPPVRKAGARFSSKCTADNASFTSEGKVVGFEKIEVAGESIDAIHTFARSLLKGFVSGVADRDEWRRRSDGLLLRRVVDADTQVDAAGGTDATENYRIDLVSTDPQV